VVKGASILALTLHRGLQHVKHPVAPDLVELDGTKPLHMV